MGEKHQYGQLDDIWTVRKPADENISAIEPWQLRAARAAVDLTAQQLADLSGLSVNSVRRVEQGAWDKMSRVNQRALVDALARRGVSFDTTKDGAAAVAFKAVDLG